MPTYDLWEDGYTGDGPPPSAGPDLLHYFARVGFRVYASDIAYCEPDCVGPEGLPNTIPTNIHILPGSPTEHALLTPLPWDTTGLFATVAASLNNALRPGDLFLAAIARANAVLAYPFEHGTRIPQMAQDGTLLAHLQAEWLRVTTMLEARQPDDPFGTDGDGPASTYTFFQTDVWVRQDGTADWQYAVSTADLPANLAAVNVLNRGNPIDELVSLAVRADLLTRMIDVAKTL